MVERGIADPSVAGSNPVVPFLTSAVVLWCNWLALWTLNPAIRVQIPVGPFCRLCLRHQRNQKVVTVGIEPTTDGLLDRRSAI